MRRALALASFALLAGCEQAADTAPEAAPEEIADVVGSQAPDKVSGASDPSSAAANPAPRTPVDCTEEEETIFSCEMAAGKRLAVCAAADGKAQYRFGKDAPELALSGGKWSNTMYSGGGESQILFSNGDTDYIVFSRMIRTNFAPGEPNNPAISDGVVIMRGEEFVGMQLCAGGQAEMPVQYDAAKRAFGEIEDIFTGATMRADPPEVER
ncbi:hypothetical protein [Pontixanthobacter luteolus]|uniref:hypothetical protein n=1 Tax=Pontixanthobacter luteolus TaxID=295089 RepID=UPI0023045703|nr:hypothetical protein [Pontixanthobacter luteolus]